MPPVTDGTPAAQVDHLGERALLIRLDDQARILALARALRDDAEAALEDAVPGDRSLLAVFDGTAAGEARARTAIERALDAPSVDVAPRRHVLPVRYGGADGPDLDEAARLVGMTPEELVARHVAVEHTVLFLGFAPGFPYLGGLPAGFALPRLATPRPAIPAGSVGIAEGYTGIYPAALPGGWRIIGRTDVPMFDPAADPPTTLAPGDRVRFEVAR